MERDWSLDPGGGREGRGIARDDFMALWSSVSIDRYLTFGLCCRGTEARYLVSISIPRSFDGSSMTLFFIIDGNFVSTSSSELRERPNIIFDILCGCLSIVGRNSLSGLCNKLLDENPIRLILLAAYGLWALCAWCILKFDGPDLINGWVNSCLWLKRSRGSFCKSRNIKSVMFSVRMGLLGSFRWKASSLVFERAAHFDTLSIQKFP